MKHLSLNSFIDLIYAASFFPCGQFTAHIEIINFEHFYTIQR